MLEVFPDTDVCIDLLSGREPFFSNSKGILDYAENLKYRLVISESFLPTLTYILSETYKIPDTQDLLIDFINSGKIISGSKAIALLALRSTFKDKEDAFQDHIALHRGVDYFLTRNIKDYKYHADLLTVLTPTDFFKKVVIAK